MFIEKTGWTACEECNGIGKKKRRIRKKVRITYQAALSQYEKDTKLGEQPTPPKANTYSCPACEGSGLILSTDFPKADTENYPHIAIIGGGIGGMALAVACLHRGIPFTLFERDSHFNERSQGYGLTLQQASKAIKGFGLSKLKEGIVSTKHIVHNTHGKVVAEWGMRKWIQSNNKNAPKRTNIHIARQSLRLALLEQLGKQNNIRWNHKLIDFKETQNHQIELIFDINGTTKQQKADLIVGADGIRSSVRKLLFKNGEPPLQYLGCMVILGICSLKNIESPLLDGATVFQTANGYERIYMMPYTEKAIMWQLSFPIPEKEALKLSTKGPTYLKEEACRRTQWHSPIPQILSATLENKISGYPVYDRKLLKPKALDTGKPITLLGDAAHPMSPFKGQGANQALLDALALAREITQGCNPKSSWKKIGIRKSALAQFEVEMLNRSASKVKESAEAAKFLHSDLVLQKKNAPRRKS